MPLTATAIAQRLTDLAVPFAGDTIQLKYRGAEAAQVNGEQIAAEMQALASGAGADATPEQKAAAQHAYLSQLDARLIASWDVVESTAEDGTPGPVVPTDAAHLAAFDDGLLTALFMAIVSDVTRSK